jgi:hypothetical protein
MNNLIKWGLFFQIPNIAIIIILAFIFGANNINFSAINLTTIFYIIIGTLYGLMNIASVILIVSGVFKK